MATIPIRFGTFVRVARTGSSLDGRHGKIIGVSNRDAEISIYIIDLGGPIPIVDGLGHASAVTLPDSCLDIVGSSNY